MTSFFQFLIESIQVDMGQHWRKWTSLRGPFLAPHHYPFGHLPASQVSPDQPQHSFVSDHLCDLAHQNVVLYMVETLSDVEIYHPIFSLSGIFLRRSHRIVRFVSWPEPIAVPAASWYTARHSRNQTMMAFPVSV
jgi:hypothetical protein